MNYFQFLKNFFTNLFRFLKITSFLKLDVSETLTIVNEKLRELNPFNTKSCEKIKSLGFNNADFVLTLSRLFLFYAQANRLEVESRLPREPNEDCGDTVTKIRVRLPKGEFIERRFYSKEPLQVLLDFLVVQGYPNNEFKVISSWPRRDVS